MSYIALDELLRRAEEARDKIGGAADRLVVFSPLVQALGDFVRREGSRVQATEDLRAKMRLLSSAILQFEKNYGPNGPSVEDVQRFYRASSIAIVALREFEKHSPPIYVRRPYKLDDR